MRATATAVVTVVLTACLFAGCNQSSPAVPSPATAAEATQPTQAPDAQVQPAAPSGSPWGPETPPFNLQAALRPVGDSGFGLVKFRQPNDSALIVNLDVWVRDLAPDTNYSLQRAVDVTVDDQCTSTGWLTLGKGLQPEPIITDASGTGGASLFRDLSAFAPGSRFDIHFRVVETVRMTPVLESGCYQFVISR
jgi:hypothetical protein